MKFDLHWQTTPLIIEYFCLLVLHNFAQEFQYSHEKFRCEMILICPPVQSLQASYGIGVLWFSGLAYKCSVCHRLMSGVVVIIIYYC